jgi:hypothetical protein
MPVFQQPVRGQVHTLVATFVDNNGQKYRSESGNGHVGAFVEMFDKTNAKGDKTTGITLMDQYKGRLAIGPSDIKAGGTRNFNSDANNYRILLVPDKVSKDK